MLARKPTSKNGKSIPQDWLEGLSRMLNESYKQECKEHKRYFDVYGQIYQDELLMVVSWLSESDEFLSPIDAIWRFVISVVGLGLIKQIKLCNQSTSLNVVHFSLTC